MLELLVPVFKKIFFSHPGLRLIKTFPFQALPKTYAISDSSVWVSTNGS